MRVGILSDVHGNLPALERMLDALGDEGVDAYACLGDLVGYGPWPNECVERLAALSAVTVAGNHDLMATGRLPVSAGRTVEETIRWTRAALMPLARRFLERLPVTAQLPGGVVLTHGSLAGCTRYVATPQAAAGELRRLALERPEASLLLLGHTHASLAYGERRGTLLYLEAGDVPLAGERFLLNPGSVGQSRERAAMACGLVVDIGARTARFLRVGYDIHAVREELRRRGRPHDAHHARPPLWRAAPLRRLRRRVTERRSGTRPG